MLSVFSPVNILRFLPHHLVMFSCIFHFPLYVVRRHHVIVRQSALVQKKSKTKNEHEKKKKLLRKRWILSTEMPTIKTLDGLLSPSCV
jgi:hypothetical protein